MMMAYLKRSWALLILGGVFLVELTKASIDVAIAVVSSKEGLKPGIVAVPLDLKTDMGIATLANLVSLTPGTTSMNVSEDRKTLHVHVLNMESEEAVIASIKDTFERRVLAVESTQPTHPTNHEGAAA